MFLTKKEKETIKRLINHMRKYPVFNGIYDAKNGNSNFMCGICSVMEYLSALISDDFADEVIKEFYKNMVKSEEKERKSH